MTGLAWQGHWALPDAMGRDAIHQRRSPYRPPSATSLSPSPLSPAESNREELRSPCETESGSRGGSAGLLSLPPAAPFPRRRPARRRRCLRGRRVPGRARSEPRGKAGASPRHREGPNPAPGPNSPHAALPPQRAPGPAPWEYQE